jgi:hypothetical protein
MALQDLLESLNGFLALHLAGGARSNVTLVPNEAVRPRRWQAIRPHMSMRIRAVLTTLIAQALHSIEIRTVTP